MNEARARARALDSPQKCPFRDKNVPKSVPLEGIESLTVSPGRPCVPCWFPASPSLDFCPYCVPLQWPLSLVSPSQFTSGCPLKGPSERLSVPRNVPSSCSCSPLSLADPSILLSSVPWKVPQRGLESLGMSSEAACVLFIPCMSLNCTAKCSLKEQLRRGCDHQ